MTKEEYLKLAIAERKFFKKSWLVSMIAMIKPVQKSDSDYEHLELIPETWGYSVWMITKPAIAVENAINDKVVHGSKVKIDNADRSRPLFTVKDRIKIDGSWFPNVFEDMEVPFGNLLFNCICIVPAFGHKFPFMRGKFSIQDIEAKVAPILQDTPDTNKAREDRFIYCDEWVRFMDCREHLRSIAHLLNQSATLKTITKSPDFNAFKKKLEKEFEGQLTNPVKLVEFEKKLQDFDNEWLKGDPADKTFLEGKVRNVARKKMHLSIGSEPGFETKSTVLPITEALDEGWPTDPDKHVSMINGIRHGSLSRGRETIKGGVTAKYLLRAGNNFSVVDGDCGAKNGLVVMYTKDSLSRLVGRYITTNSSGEVKYLATKEDVAPYQDKYVRLRSPAYCRMSGDRVCKVCGGDGLALNPNGVSIALTEMSSIVMNDFMKAMHDTTIKTVKLNLDDILS